MDFVGKARGDHGRQPAALAKANKIDAPAEIVDHDHHVGEIVVDVEILLVVGRRFPFSQRHVVDAVGQERLNQTLALMIVGDHGGMVGVGSINQRRDSLERAVVGQRHGSQVGIWFGVASPGRSSS